MRALTPSAHPDAASPPAPEQAPAAGLPAGRGWYVCLTKPRQEGHAAAKLHEQGYEVYLPMLERWSRRAGAWQKVSSVMFPRYCFVRPGHPQQAIGPVRSTPGVSSLVSFGHVLACLRADKVEALREVVAEQAAALPGQPLEPGSQVVFCAGPLKGASGIVSQVASERVTVLMTLLGREQTVAAAFDDLAQTDPGR